MITLALNEIRIDGGTQARNAIDSVTVAEYAERYAADKPFPALDVFHDGKEYWMGDGFHRYHAARRAGKQKHECNVYKGTVEDARWFAVGANASHGLKRTNADKRRSVEMALQMHPEHSDRMIADYVAVSHTFVAETRAQVATVATSNAVHVRENAPDTRTGRDGKQYPAPPADPPRTEFPPPPAAPRGAPPMPPPPAERKPKEPHGRDSVGRVIPDVCAEVFQRAGDARHLLKMVSEVRCALEKAQNTKDPVFSEINFSGARAAADRLYDALTVAVPYAVCPSCQGNAKLTGCRLCSGRGAISRFKWDTCVPEETKRRIEGLRK